MLGLNYRREYEFDPQEQILHYRAKLKILKQDFENATFDITPPLILDYQNPTPYGFAVANFGKMTSELFSQLGFEYDPFLTTSIKILLKNAIDDHQTKWIDRRYNCDTLEKILLHMNHAWKAVLSYDPLNFGLEEYSQQRSLAKFFIAYISVMAMLHLCHIKRNHFLFLARDDYYARLLKKINAKYNLLATYRDNYIPTYCYYAPSCRHFINSNFKSYFVNGIYITICNSSGSSRVASWDDRLTSYLADSVPFDDKEEEYYKVISEYGLSISIGGQYGPIVQNNFGVIDFGDPSSLPQTIHEKLSLQRRLYYTERENQLIDATLSEHKALVMENPLKRQPPQPFVFHSNKLLTRQEKEVLLKEIAKKHQEDKDYKLVSSRPVKTSVDMNEIADLTRKSYQSYISRQDLIKIEKKTIRKEINQSKRDDPLYSISNPQEEYLYDSSMFKEEKIDNVIEEFFQKERKVVVSKKEYEEEIWKLELIKSIRSVYPVNLDKVDFNDKFLDTLLGILRYYYSSSKRGRVKDFHAPVDEILISYLVSIGERILEFLADHAYGSLINKLGSYLAELTGLSYYDVLKSRWREKLFGIGIGDDVINKFLLWLIDKDWDRIMISLSQNLRVNLSLMDTTEISNIAIDVGRIGFVT